MVHSCTVVVVTFSETGFPLQGHDAGVIAGEVHGCHVSLHEGRVDGGGGVPGWYWYRNMGMGGNGVPLIPNSTVPLLKFQFRFLIN